MLGIQQGNKSIMEIHLGLHKKHLGYMAGALEQYIKSDRAASLIMNELPAAHWTRSDQASPLKRQHKSMFCITENPDSLHYTFSFLE